MKIFLACPYTDDDPAIREERFRAANKAAAWLIEQGHVVYSAVTHGHPITEINNQMTWEFWKRQNFTMLSLCEQLTILALAGWEKSAGISVEIQESRRLKLPLPNVLWPAGTSYLWSPLHGKGCLHEI